MVQTIISKLKKKVEIMPVEYVPYIFLSYGI